VKRWLLGLGLALPVAAAAALAFVISTEAGLRWTFGAVARMVPGELSASRVAGRLVGPLNIDGLRYRQRDITVELDELRADLRPWDLVASTLRLTHLEARGLRVTAGGRGPEAAGAPLPNLYLPVRVVVEDGVLQDLSVIAGAARPVALERVELAVEADLAGIHLRHLRARAARWDLAVRGVITPRGAYPLMLDTEWSIQAEGGSLRGTGRLAGDLTKLSVEQSLAAPMPAQLTGSVSELTGEPRWQARITLPQFDGRSLNPDWPPFLLAATVDAQGDLAGAQAAGRFQAEADPLGKVQGELELAGWGSRWQITRLALERPAGETRVEARGTLELAGAQTQAALEGNWQGLVWPLDGAARLRSARGAFALRGGLDSYQLNLDFPLAGERIPEGEWRVEGAGDRRGLRLSSIRGRFLKGSVEGQGELAWDGAGSWQATFQGEGLDPGAFWADWPGALALAGSARGTLSAARPLAALDIAQVRGTLRGRAFSARVQVALEEDRYRLPVLEIRSGSARLHAAGTVAEAIELDWRIDATDLADVLPKARGRLVAEGTLRGPRALPELVGQVDAKDVVVGEFAAGRVDGNWRVDLQDKSDSQIRLQGEALRWDAWQVDELSVEGRGRTARHELKARLRRGSESVSAVLGGSLLEREWTGSLASGVIETLARGRWVLEQPVSVQASAEAAGVAHNCWGDGTARICLEAGWRRATGWSVSGSAERFRLEALHGLMPEAVQMQGEVAGRGQVEYHQGRVLAASADLDLGPGAVVLTDAELGRREWRYEGGRVRLTKRTADLSSEFDVRLPDGAVTGNIAVPLSATGTQVLADRPLSGSVHAEIRDLTVVEAVVPQLQGVQGGLFIDLSLAGTLEQPALSGRGTVDGGAFDVPAAGLHVSEMRLEAHSNGTDTLLVKGSARSGKGRLDIDGQVRLAAQWSATLAVRGDRFEALRTPEAGALVSPRLALKIQPRRIDLTGELDIPEARFEPRDVSQAVVVSRDVVVAGGAEPARREPGWQIYSNVRVTLADTVRFKGFGFDGRVAGSLVLVDQPGKITTARGGLHVVEGTYKAYGQALTVEQGRLLFADTPVDNPGLDLRAVRKAGEVTAGARVRGTVKAPELALFSTPPMAQADILSYLVLGRPVSQVTQAEGQVLMSAASTVGLAGGELLAGWIGRELGLTDVRIESDASAQQPWLVVGTYLSPRLYVSYGLGLFEAGSTVHIRYRLGRKWTLQAESGRESGADLLYSIERP